MLRRKAYDKLLAWKATERRKALCIFGARQTGKTTLIRTFGREQYRHFVEINFITDESAGDIFSGKLDADTIITNLTAYVRQPLVPGETLVLFDEVQACPAVRTAIKFLVEDGRFDYIESGSLLGTSFREVRSFPVGFEELYRMFPLDFEEFLWAVGVQSETIHYLRGCFETLSPVTDSAHDTMKKLFYSYIVVGGMPEVVQLYVDTHDIGQVIRLQNSILALYRQDIGQDANGNEKIKIRAIFDSIPAQLNDKNRRFYINSISSTARISRYDNSFRWLDDAGVALPCYNVNAPQPPLGLNEKHSLFKLFMGDVGLLCAACMENIQFALLNGRLDCNLGSILENAIAQELRAGGYTLYYFDASRYGEVDFVVANGLQIDLIEVKSGKDYRSHRALDNVCAVAEWTFRRKLVLCAANVREDGGVTYLPWYFCMFLRPEEPPEALRFEVDLRQLPRANDQPNKNIL